MSSPIVPRSVPTDSRFTSRSALLIIARSPRSPQRSAGDMSTCCAGVCGTTVAEGCAELCDGCSGVSAPAVPFPAYGVCGGIAVCCCCENTGGGGTPGGAGRCCGCCCVWPAPCCEGCTCWDRFPFVGGTNADACCALGLALGEFHAAAAAARLL